MKQFLRYQVSGTVFLLWVIVFYYGSSTSDVKILISNIFKDMDTLKPLAGLISALPIGVIIHQISVLFKNYVTILIWKEFDDFPNRALSIYSKNPSEFDKYIAGKISNLNSFYYVRFDNGFLSPFIAWVLVYFSMEKITHCSWTITAMIICAILIAYIPRIKNEIKEYNKILLSSSSSNT